MYVDPLSKFRFMSNFKSLSKILQCSGCAYRQHNYCQAIVSSSPHVFFYDMASDIPRPFTPYSGLKLVELAQRFFPPGVVQSLSGDDNLGPWLTSHPGIDKISFTGSTHTGKLVAQSAAKGLKRVTLEL
jgi:hypothetical protein